MQYFGSIDYATFSSFNLPATLDSLSAVLKRFDKEQLNARPLGTVELVADYLARVCCAWLPCLRKPRSFGDRPHAYADYAASLVCELESLTDNSIVALAASRSQPDLPDPATDTQANESPDELPTLLASVGPGEGVRQRRR